MNDFWFINTGLGRVCVLLRHGAAFDVSLQQIQRRGVGARHELQEAGHPALAAGTICMWCTSLLTHTRQHVIVSLNFRLNIREYLGQHSEWKRGC